MFTHCAVDATKARLDYYKDYRVNTTSKGLKEHTTEIINYEKRQMIPLTYEQNRFHKKQEVCDICRKEFNTDKNDKNQT